MPESSPDNTPKKDEEPQLPPLTPQEFKKYNRLAEHMDHFHSNFRNTWNTLHTACTTNKRPGGLSLRSFLALGLQFAEHLEMHHSIEENYVFPKLAARMPAFQRQKELLAQHRQIHAGLEDFTEYIKECKSGERELVLRELGEKMEVFGEVLWKHLDQEVWELGAERMRKWWTVEEMGKLGF